MKLYEINQAIENVIEYGFHFNEETGEILFEADDLDGLQSALNEKLEACAVFVKDLEATVRAIKAEEHALASRRRTAEIKAERLKEYIACNMLQAGYSKLETPRCAVSIRKSKRTVIESEADIPEQFKTVVESVKLDKTAIKKAINSGEEVPGAHVQVVDNLQIK